MNFLYICCVVSTLKRFANIIAYFLLCNTFSRKYSTIYKYIMEIRERVVQYLDSKNITKYKFYKETGFSNGFLDKPGAIGSDKCEIICSHYPDLNIEWLIIERGNMIIPEELHEIKENELYLLNNFKEKKHQHQLIPIYNIEAAAGLVSLFNNPNGFIPIDYISLPNVGKVDGGLYAFGDSMYPLIKSGDIVVFRRLIDMFDSIFYGEMYLLSYDLEGEEYIVIKYIQKSDKPDHIKLVSQNQHHSPKDIPMRKVNALALIKASVRFNTIRPNN